MSDHGFASFHSCVNLNAWLKANGFLALKDDADECPEYFENVDWSHTQAYAVGLGGIFINRAGREGRGIVRDGKERDAVASAIAQGLGELTDPQTGEKVISRVYDTHQHYNGPYLDNGPDLIVGFGNGYRVSWDCVTGGFSSAIIEDNGKAWSGDHCIDPDLVPGVLFCNCAVDGDNPGIVDIAPTVLDALGVPRPVYMDGVSFLPRDGSSPDDDAEAA